MTATVVLGVPVRRVGPDALCGRAAQLVVEAVGTVESGWRVVARDLRDDALIAYGVGGSLASAEVDAQEDFAERMTRRSSRRRRAA